MMNSLIISYIWQRHGYFPLFTSTTLSNRRIIKICLIDAYIYIYTHTHMHSLICIRDFVLQLVFLTLCKMTRASYCAGIEEFVILLPRVHVCFSCVCLFGWQHLEESKDNKMISSPSFWAIQQSVMSVQFSSLQTHSCCQIVAGFFCVYERV
jgi:hypothetical protein